MALNDLLRNDLTRHRENKLSLSGGSYIFNDINKAFKSFMAEFLFPKVTTDTNVAVIIP